MIGSVPRGPDLRATITTLVSQANLEDRRTTLRDRLPQRLTAAVAWLFHLVEHSYLLEFLMFDHLSIRMVKREFFLPGTPNFALGALVIVIGGEQIWLHVVGLEDTCVCVRISNTRHSLVRELYCDVSEDQPTWTTAANETGLRRLIKSILPEKRVDLDEAVFRSLLNQMLLGPQPVFSIGPSAVKQGLGALLDTVTSDPVRTKLALGVQSSASEVGRQLRLAAPSARQAVLKALPGRRVPASLLLDGVPARVGYRGPRDREPGTAPAETPG